MAFDPSRPNVDVLYDGANTACSSKCVLNIRKENTHLLLVD